MVILIPWKPVVFIWLLLSAMLWFGYVGSSLLEGKNPFAPYTLQVVQGRHSIRSVRHQGYAHELRARLSCEKKFHREKDKDPQPR